MPKATAPAAATGLHGSKMTILEAIEAAPGHQGFYAAIGRGACRMAETFAPLRDLAVAVELLSEDILAPAHIETPLSKRDANALLFLVYELSGRALVLCSDWDDVHLAARAAETKVL